MTITLSRSELLHSIARNYVLTGLGGKNFNSIPYDEAVELRAPLNPGGQEHPIKGRKNLLQYWWIPLPEKVSGLELLDTYINRDLTAVTVEFHCHIMQPNCTVRMINRFIINEAGKIIAQEDFFDPRPVITPA